MERSLLPLYHQFCMANGLEIPRIDNIVLHQGFYDWVTEMQVNAGPRYLNFLNFLGLGYFNSRGTAEVGKGAFDSLVASDKFETQMISPPKIAGNIRGLRKLMLTGFMVNNNLPCLLDDERRYVLKYGDPYYNFMTQNPYRSNNVLGWPGMHNNNGYGVIVGVFGRVQDDDRERKVEFVKNFSDRLSDSVIGDYVEDDSYYFCVAGNKPMTIRRGFNKPHTSRR